jgi:hypothetical protein
MHKRTPRKCTAGMLLCAILSDTLNLLGPTTTDWDRTMVALLTQVAGVEDINFLASMQVSPYLSRCSPPSVCPPSSLKTASNRPVTY